MKLATVLAHIAGPSGSGKTTLGDQLAVAHPGLVVKDLDTFDEVAAAKLFGDKRKRDYTDANITALAEARQALMDAFLKKNKAKSVVLVGHHTEGDTVLRIPTERTWMLSTSPRSSALRALKRSQGEQPDHRRTRAELPGDIREAEETAAQLKGLGYSRKTPAQIKAEVQSMLTKSAEVSTELKPHQQRVIDRIKQQPGLVVAHGMGSGKTLTSIAAAEAMGGPTTVLAPAALQSNYRKEIAKHITGTPNAEFNIGSLQRAALHGEIAPAKTLIVDEAHRLRDPGSMARKAVRDAEVEKRLLLTGTALYNRPYDLASLVNVAAGDNVFPGTQADFDRQYIGEKVTQPGWFAKTFRGVKPGSTPTLKNEKQLGDILQKWVDYHENNTEGFPTRHDETVNVDMSPKQQELYDFSMGKAPAWVKYKIQHGLPPSKAESKDLNAFSGAVRQVSVSPGGFSKEMSPEEAASYSPKIQEAYKRLAAGIAANPQHRAVVYSNFLDSGLSPYESLLKQHNVAYGKFTGDVKPADRDKMVADYNSGALKALLLSSAGGEGLDLKGTRQIQVLEPHWNKEKLEQVIARGIRYKSHEALPEDQRSVNVEHYMSQMPEPGAIRKLLGAKRPGAIDGYLEMMSKDKDNLNQQVRELLKKTDQTPAAPKTAGAYLNHAALNLGQAARDVRYFGNHPHADDVAEKGTAKHVAASVVARIPSLTSNLYYAALPPGLHHKKEDLEAIHDTSPMDWFMHGYKPWEHPDPQKKTASLSTTLSTYRDLVEAVVA